MKWKWILCAVLMAGLLCSCGKKEEPPIQEEPGAVEPVTAGNAEELLAKLTVQEKVGQLFLISPDALDTTQPPQQRQDPNQPGLTQVDASARNVLKDYPVGGFVCTAKQLQDPDQLESLMTRLSQSSRVPPLFAIEEEGGSRSPFAGKETFSSPRWRIWPRWARTETRPRPSRPVWLWAAFSGTWVFTWIWPPWPM